ncbi:hypothetical protein SO802_010725 [Lithocarpus litseifolius]|uniref:Uncharacterized protein n=1 Tax=Lithocarpus litseifolius TaxID=425828 RepID=A0AAW2DHN0_9ROSI
MAPKKSVPSKNPITHCGSSSTSSSSSSLSIPNRVRFRDANSQKDFVENFYDRAIHLERQVILSAFSFRGWEYLCEKPTRGTRIVDTPDLFSGILRVLKVDHPDYPRHPRLRNIPHDELASIFSKKAMVWEDTLNFFTTEFAKGPRIFYMVMTFVLTPQSHYNTVIEPRAHFLLSLQEDLSIDFPSHMIVSMIDIYRDTATAAKWPHVEPTLGQQDEAAFRAAKDAAYTSQPSFSSTPSSSSRVEASLAAIKDQLQHMRADFGSRLNQIYDEMC